MKYQKTYQWLEEKCSQIKDLNLRKLFKNCFLSTLTTTVKEKEDSSVYVFTGDIPAMWLRDSSSQVNPYVRLCNVDPEITSMIKGVIKRQFFYIGIDAYANAFNEFANGNGHKDITLLNDWVWERKFEIDSLCYPLWLTSKYYEETGDKEIFDDLFVKTVKTILNVFETEQDHDANSTYYFLREGMYASDTLDRNGKGCKCKVNGLVWSAFRPSDDKCKYGYLIPSNMFIVVVMRFLIQVFSNIKKDEALLKQCTNLMNSVQAGLDECASFLDEKGNLRYAYETDGFGNAYFVDDANMPSLLSLPYLGYCDANSPIYASTRKILLSNLNEYYYEGSFASGIGSPHTPKNYIWHLGLIIQGLTSTNNKEKIQILKMLNNTHAGTFYMHEGFDKDNPSNFTREWFGWANSMFSEYFMDNFELFKDIVFD